MIKINGFSSSSLKKKERKEEEKKNNDFENCAENIVNFSIKIDDYGFKAILMVFGFAW